MLHCSTVAAPGSRSAPARSKGGGGKKISLKIGLNALRVVAVPLISDVGYSGITDGHLAQPTTASPTQRHGA
jgi:hypothetical protein